MSKDLGIEEAFLVMDCASWYRSKGLKSTKNITMIYLPPYSPELNLVERLLQYIKHNILHNKIYDTISLLEDVVCKFITNISSTTIKQICYVPSLFVECGNWYNYVEPRSKDKSTGKS